MNILKTIIRKAVGAAGYEIKRRPAPSAMPAVSYENFASLVDAYEQLLRSAGAGIEPNRLRPALLARLTGTQPSEAYFIVQALAKCRDISGDICEFGVAQGETSALLATEIASGEKRLHLFDSFEGLPPPTDKDRLQDDIFSLGSMEAYAGKMACPEDRVRKRMQAISFPESRISIHKGFIERLIHEDPALPENVCFAYVDFDFYEPIRVALDFLHGVTSPGSIVIVDDYDYFSTGAKTAVDEFLADKNTQGTVYDCFVPDKRFGCFAQLTRKD